MTAEGWESPQHRSFCPWVGGEPFLPHGCLLVHQPSSPNPVLLEFCGGFIASASLNELFAIGGWTQSQSLSSSALIGQPEAKAGATSSQPLITRLVPLNKPLSLLAFQKSGVVERAGLLWITKTRPVLPLNKWGSQGQEWGSDPPKDIQHASTKAWARIHIFWHPGHKSFHIFCSFS